MSNNESESSSNESEKSDTDTYTCIGQLADFNSSNTSSSESETEVKKMKYEWLSEKTFNNEDDIKNFFLQEKNWKKDYTNKISDGIKTYFRCNIVHKIGKQCPAKIYLFKRNEDDITELFRNEKKHDHESAGILLSQIPLSSEIADKIEEMYLLNLKKRAILHKLNTDETIPVKPTKNQVFFEMKFKFE